MIYAHLDASGIDILTLFVLIQDTNKIALLI